jgi:hypothetical protein
VNINPTDLVAYCGGFCGRCAICSLNIQTSLDALRNVVQAAAFRQQAETLGWPLMRDIATHACAQFEGQVESFAEMATKLFPTHCRDGCVPGCAIAASCREQGYLTCAECAEMDTCETLGKHYARVSVNLSEIRKKGVRAWAQVQFGQVVSEKRQRLLDAVNKAFEQERTESKTQ